MMNKYLIIFLLSLGVVISFTASAATEEQESVKACKQYEKVAKSKNDREPFKSCTSQNRSPLEWKCMQKKRFIDGLSYTDAKNSCFKDAPGLKIVEQQTKYLELFNPSKICEMAFDKFQQHGQKIGVPKSTLCSTSERTSAMWACMAAYADQGNSYEYSKGQCFPRQK